MYIDRRRFLTAAGASIAAAAVTNVAAANRANEPSLWKLVRMQFDQLAADQIHLSSFFLVSHPQPVREAIEKHRKSIDENPFEYIEKNMITMPGKVQAAAAEYLGGKPDEVAITNSTTMGLALVYHGLPVKAGQEILVTEHDHFVHHESARLAAERAGASVRKISLYADSRAASENEIVERIKKGIGPKTRVVGITWVHSGTGVKLPVRAIANAVADANKGRADADRIQLIVDGVHGFGVEDESVADMGADFFIAGTHKWIFGPRGTGIVWAKAENWKSLRMLFPAFAKDTFSAWLAGSVPNAPMQASWMTQGGFHAFEYEWSLPAAFEFQKKIGRENASRRIHSLNDQCKEGLAAIKNVRLRTPPGSKLSSGLIAFEVDRMKPAEVVERLHAKRIIASTAPYKESYVRVAPSLLNTPEEIEATLRSIRELA